MTFHSCMNISLKLMLLLQLQFNLKSSPEELREVTTLQMSRFAHVKAVSSHVS